MKPNQHHPLGLTLFSRARIYAQFVTAVRRCKRPGCDRRIGSDRRADSEYCSKRCQQVEAQKRHYAKRKAKRG